MISSSMFIVNVLKNQKVFIGDERPGEEMQ